MSRTAVQMYRVALVLALAGMLVACGNSTNTMVESPSSTTAAVVSVSISPTSGVLGLGQGQTTQFTATVSGTSNTAVTWSVNGTAGGNSTVGTVGTDGIFTPPNLQAPLAAGVPAPGQEVTVTATSVADPTKSASASVILVSQGQVSATQNPQVAQYSFNSPVNAAVRIQFGPTTTYGLQTWAQPVPAGGGVLNMLVAGMKANTAYHMRAVVDLPGGLVYYDPDQTFTTGAGLPASRLPDISITVPAGPNTSPGIELLALVNQFSPPPANQIETLAVDLQGNVIWYYDFSTIPGTEGDDPFPIKLLSNGHMKIVIGSPSPNAPVSMVQEIDLAGNVISQLTTAQLNQKLAQAGSNMVSAGFHHDFAVLPNGHTIYLVMDVRNETLSDGTQASVTGDDLVDVDANGDIAWTWSAFDNLDVNYHPFQFPDWTHSNALVYSQGDGNLILSCRNLSWVMKIDYENGIGNGDILWKLGPNGDFALTNGGPYDWFYNQHYPNIIGQPTFGNFELGIWDNGNTRPNPATGVPCGTGGYPGGVGACYSRGLLLQINEPTKTATINWQDNLSPVFADCCGNINVLSDGDVDMGAGGASFIPPATEALEVTQQATPQVVWQMNISGQFSYRILRIPSLYPGVTW